MTTPASPVTTTTDLVYVGGNALPVPQIQTIYTVTAVPERIESVFCTVAFVSNSVNMDIFSVQLCDQSGAVLYEQPTPPLLGINGAVMQAILTWSRLGNDTAQLPAAQELFSTDNVRRTWCNMRLPDLVLRAGAFVNLLGYVEDGGEGSPIPVSNIAVTVTRSDALLASTTTTVGIPLLTDVSTG